MLQVPDTTQTIRVGLPVFERAPANVSGEGFMMPHVSAAGSKDHDMQPPPLPPQIAEEAIPILSASLGPHGGRFPTTSTFPSSSGPPRIT